MRRSSFCAFSAALLALAGLARARPVTPETLAGLAEKADVLVVGAVIKVEDVGEEQSEKWKMAVVRKRATIRVVRGIRTADASEIGWALAEVEFLAAKEGPAAEGPYFPQVQVGQVAVFPLKPLAGKVWQFVSEEDVGMIMPAAEREIGVGWPADVPGNVAFLYRELAGTFLNGDFVQTVRAARYLDNLGPDKVSPVDMAFGLMKAAVGENLLREDPRWLSIAVAAYMGTGTPRPTIDALLAGRIASGGAAAAGGEDLPERASLRMAALCLRKASRLQLAERVLMVLIAHQEDPGLAWGVATALLDNFGNAPAMLSMEGQEFRTGKPGALYVADYMVKDRLHPLAKMAVEGARKALAYGGAAREFPKDAAYSAELRETMGLILRAGSDEDMAYLVDLAGRAGQNDAKLYQAIILLAGDSELSPPDRVLKICKIYINDPMELQTAPWPGFRACDMAALTAARVGKQDFGLNPEDPAEKRDAAIAKAAEWLKGR
jgi:hypothetical protein